MSKLNSRAFALTLAVGLLAGCGGGGSKAKPGSTTESRTDGGSMTESPPSQHELAQTYLRIVKPANAEADRFNAKANRWDDSTTNAQAAKDAAPLIAAIQKADGKLLRVHWPAATEADIKALIRADGALIGDLRALKGVDMSSAGSLSNQFERDAGDVQAAANIVRADLGLPPGKP